MYQHYDPGRTVLRKMACPPAWPRPVFPYPQNAAAHLPCRAARVVNGLFISQKQIIYYFNLLCLFPRERILTTSNRCLRTLDSQRLRTFVL